MSSKRKLNLQCWVAGGVFIGYLSMTCPGQAQIAGDETLSTNVNTTDNLSFTITGGRAVGNNLFHSFREFSIPTGGVAVFDFNEAQINNVFSRVTGSSISHINGLLKAAGHANLFIINPNGIIFGHNSRLEIGGSFIASTAAQINFVDGTVFSAIDPQVSSLLTVSIPIGLQLRQSPGSIINQSRVEDNFGEAVGLQVEPGKTIALIGSDVLLDRGRLFAPGGRIEIGSVAGNSLVGLTQMGEGWTLGYESVQSFQDIQLSQEASIDTFQRGESSGNILLQGRHIAVNNGSFVTAINEGANKGGMISIKAYESVEVSSFSSVNTLAYSTGASGDITIETRRLIIHDHSFVDTSNQNDGQGGNLTVNASESVEIDGSGAVSQLSTTTQTGSKMAGDLTVTTGSLILRDGGQITSSTSAGGNGGTVNIYASKSIEVSGRGIVETGNVLASGLFASTTGERTTGDGGALSINTGRLIVKDGGAISVAAREGSTGQAGSLEINASESVIVSGTGSILLTESESPKPAGNLTIGTGELIIQDGGEVSVSATGEGGAGNLQINAPSIRLNQQGILRAETRAGEGNITLQAQDIILRNNSKITTDATGEASGGNITINTDVLAALENSDITANAEAAQGGRVSITAQGIFGTEESDITARSDLGPEFSGTVELNTPEVDPSRGLVELPETVVDPNALIAQNPCKKGAESEFTITGRGSLPPSLNEDLSSEAVQVGLVEPVSPPETEAQSQRASLDTSPIQNPKPPGRTESEQRKTKTPIVPAQGWVFNDDKGEVVLTAYTPTVTGSQRQPTNPAICPAP